jgi:hypothetical protein
MFLSGVKAAIIEGLDAVYGAGYQGDISVKSIGIDYPMKEKEWPAIFVQFRPSKIEWTGINPKNFEESSDPDWDWENVQFCNFEGDIDLQILALTSQERDRIWDAVVQMVLMGRGRADTALFYTVIEGHDLISMTLQQTTLSATGDVVAPGTPWGPDSMAYEASLRLHCTGQFYADGASEKFISLTEITSHPLNQGLDETYGEDDGQGEWNTTGR